VRHNLIKPVLQTLKNIKGIKLHFYGPNNIIVPDFDFVVKHGMVSHEESLKAQENAAMLLSMGNKESAFIPSKIIEYISTGKKIIHFCFNEYDSAFHYYSKYENCLFININNSLNERLSEIKNFIYANKKCLTYSQLREIFPECEAQYTFNEIADFFGLKYRN
jgi:hypothetical protein